MRLLPKLIALGLATLTLAPAATAQKWGVQFGKQTRNGHVSVSATNRGFGIDLTRGRRARAHAHVHGASCRYQPGRYEVVRQREWIPGCTERVWVPAEIEVYYDECGNRIERVICPARWELVETPGRWEWRERRVWVAPSYQCGTTGSCGTSAPYRRGSGVTAYPPHRRR